MKNPEIQDQSSLFDMVYNMALKCEEYLSKYLLNKAEILIYSLDFNNFRKTILSRHSESLKAIVLIFSKIIRERSSVIREWLTKSIEELSALIVRIEEFVVKKANMDRIQA